MRLTDTETGAETQGVLDETSAQIEMGAKAFKVLSDKLYTDKIAAVLREVGCNARDAHVAAGQPDLPIQVKLPGPLNKTFSIKDWGIGLDKEEVMNMYLTYFKSTKSDSDAFVGAFGLGSKSPLAYTDSFSVVAAKEGVQRTFAVFLDRGIPKCVFLHEEPAPADWQQGLEVSFSAKAGDVGLFAQKAAAVYEFWDVKPEFVGAEVTFPKPDGLVETASCAVFSPARSVEVVMGGVRYPLDNATISDIAPRYHSPSQPFDDSCFHGEETSWIKAHDKDHLRALLATFLWGLRPSLKAPIGRLQVTPSRESLSMDEGTKRNLSLLTLEGARELCAKLVEALARREGESIWDVAGRVDGTLRGLNRSSVQGMLSAYCVLAGLDADGTETRQIFGKWLQVGAGFPLSQVETYGRQGRSRLSPVHESHGGMRGVTLSSQTVFVIDDIQKRSQGALRCLRYAASAWNGVSSYERHAVYFIDPAGKTFDEVREALGHPPVEQFVRASSLPKPERAQRTAPAGGQVVAGPKHAVGQVQATLYQWDKEEGCYARQAHVRRAALLDGAQWTLLAETSSLLKDELAKLAVGALGDEARKSVGLDVVAVVRRVVYDRYITQPTCHSFPSCIQAAIPRPEAMEALEPAMRLVRAKEVVNYSEELYSTARARVYALFDTNDDEFLRLVTAGVPFSHWLKALRALSQDLVTAVPEPVATALVALVARHPAMPDAEPRYPHVMGLVVEAFDQQRERLRLRPVKDLVPSVQDWAEAFALAIGDDEDVWGLARMLADWKQSGFSFLPTVCEKHGPASGNGRAKCVAGVMKRLSARTRRQQLAALRRERAEKRKARRAAKAQEADPTIDMFAEAEQAAA